MTLTQLLDKWAESLRDKAAQKDTSLQESTDAFKAVAAYHATQQKGRKKNEDDESDSDGFSFADEVVNGGNPKAATRRNS